MQVKQLSELLEQVKHFGPHCIHLLENESSKYPSGHPQVG
jgi:hypothetical protein